MKKRIGITGGAGFIASHLIEELLERDHEIVVLDNFSRNAFRFLPFQKHSRLKVIHGDVLKPEDLEKAFRGCEAVIHCAAIAGIHTIRNSPRNTLKVNLLGTVNSLEAAVKCRVKRFIYFSTSEVYGPFVYKGNEQNLTTLGPVGEERWVYAVSKLAGEHWAHTYNHPKQLNVAIVRPFNVYGPRQVGEGAVEQMVRNALNHRPITVYNDGTQIRSWCYVKDFVTAITALLTKNSVSGEVLNIGNPQATLTVLGLAQQIIRQVGSRSKINFKPFPGPEVEMRVPDISKAKQMLGFSPKVGLEEGLVQTIAWYRKWADA